VSGPILVLGESVDLVLEAGKRTRLEMPTGVIVPGYWLTVETDKPVRLELVDAPHGSEANEAIPVRTGPFQVQIGRGEAALSADRKTKVRIRVDGRPERW
jgi:hypothetical protein